MSSMSDIFSFFFRIYNHRGGASYFYLFIPGAFFIHGYSFFFFFLYGRFRED